MGKLDTTFHHIVLLNSLKDAPSQLKKAVLDGNVSEDELHKHLVGYAKQLHSDMQNSANDESADGDGKNGKKASSTAEKTLRFLRDADAADGSKPTGAAELGTEDRGKLRRQKLGKVFDGK